VGFIRNACDTHWHTYPSTLRDDERHIIHVAGHDAGCWLGISSCVHHAAAFDRADFGNCLNWICISQLVALANLDKVLIEGIEEPLSKRAIVD